MQSAEEQRRPIDAVFEREQHAVATGETEVRESSGNLSYAPRERTVGELSLVVDVRQLLWSHRVPGEQVRSEVESRRRSLDAQHGRHDVCV